MESTYSNAKPWALLAYTVANDRGSGDSLDAAAKEELKAICDACDFARVGVATQVDFKNIPGIFRAVLGESPTPDHQDVPADRYPLWREVQSQLMQSKLALSREATKLNSARGGVLQEFLQFGHEQCRAERHVIYFYGHSHGPMGLYFDKDAGKRAPATSMRLNDLADALHTPDCRAALLMFRDCFMSTLEAAYQLSGVAEFMMASQSEVPIAGVWPWQAFMDSLTPSATSEDQARAFATALGRFLRAQPNRGKFADAPMTLVNLNAAADIVAPLKTLVDAIEGARSDAPSSAAIAGAFESARVGTNTPADPGDPALVDVQTLCDNLQRLKSDPAVVAAAAALGDVVRVGNQLVVAHYAQRTPSPHHGVALYYKPVTKKDKATSYIYDEGFEKDDEDNYEKLALNVATGWHRVALNPLSAT
jgi:hypothetical protein